MPSYIIYPALILKCNYIFNDSFIRLLHLLQSGLSVFLLPRCYIKVFMLNFYVNGD